MPGDIRQQSPSVSAGSKLPVGALWTVLGLTFVTQLVGVLRRNINWDEFLFLSGIYRAERHEPLEVLQTAYVHLFGWLPEAGATELDQILIARAVYVLLWGLSLVLLYRLGRRVLDPLGAFAAVVLFAAFSYCLTHAASFRIDGLLLPVLLGHVLLLAEPTPRRLIAGGALFGVAVVLSIKAALWAPVSGLLLLFWIRERRTTWPVALGAVATGMVVAGLLLLLHRAAVAPAGPAGSANPVTSTVRGLAPIFSYMFLEQGLFPRSAVLADAVLVNLMTVSLLALGLVLAAIDLKTPDARRPAALLMILALPAASVAFYANAWPYAYVTLIPTACLLAGYAVVRLSRLRHAILLVVIAGAAAPVAGSLWELRSDGQEAQREVISAVHDLFKMPVPYIDRTGMIPSFPRAASNLTQFGLSLYNQRGVPSLANNIRTLHPPLLIVNTPVLDVWEENGFTGVRLLPEDEAALRAAYAPYWGAIYLAGREWRDLDAGKTLAFEIVIPGDYTLVSDVPVRIDGELHKGGATLALAGGEHTLETIEKADRLRILWGRDLTIPTAKPSQQPIFTGL